MLRFQLPSLIDNCCYGSELGSQTVVIEISSRMNNGYTNYDESSFSTLAKDFPQQ